jgi:hypothetical protein
LFCCAPHLTNNKDRKKGHPSLLLGGKALIERPPRIGEALEISCALGQGIGASAHECDGIAVAQDFHETTIAYFGPPCCGGCEAGFPVLPWRE